MIRHALTLEHVARALNGILVGGVVESCWTQEKGTLDVRFVNEKYRTQHNLHIDVSGDLGSIQLRSDVVRARKNSVDLFPELTNHACMGVRSVEGDRVVSLTFADRTLHILLYSGGKGNVVIEQNGHITDALHDKKHLFGTLPSFHQSEVILGKYYAALSTDSEHTIARCRESKAYFLLEKDEEVLFSLLPLEGWTISLQTDDVFDAIRQTVSKRRHHVRFKSLMSNAERELLREKNRHEKAIINMQRDDVNVDHAAAHRLVAQLLISQPSQNDAGAQSITVTNWDGVEQTITLDPKLTLNENAQKYFDKARRSEAAAAERKERLPKTQQRLAEVIKELEQLHSISDVRKLETMAKETTKEENAPSTKYREFELGEGYVLYVGKNAANNDELTMKFAKQNDVWLHARGSSGSHAVLRNLEGDTQPPKKILEKAAEIAAYYSGSRNASWTPVVYTLRKYVRKPKGANVGAVVLERESVVMVKPGLPTA